MNSSPSGPKQEAGDKILYWGGDEVHNPPRHHSSEVSTSGDELVKVRKPYTITKQRERWTEEEHEKFLEALKLHGRAWRRIEEHIGTKTAVQIRSHAQKFFSKLEREQAAGGILPGTIQDIDIPPPRPKRKPSHPYPRKATDAAMASPAPIQSPSAPAPALEHGEPGKGLERSKSELKLFGQTVVVPTATRAVAPDRGVEIGEAQLSPELKIDPEHGQVGPFVATHHDAGSEELHQHQQQPPPGVDLSAVYYSKVWERFAETMYPFGVEGGGSLWPFQYHRSGVSPGCWPSFSPTSLNDITSSVMRAIMAGSHPSAHHMSESSSAALAAATVAAASAWWALQGSVPPGFVPNTASGAPPEAGGNPGEEPASEDLEKGVAEVEMDDESLKLSPSRSIKRGTLESQEAGRKRARVRSSVGSSGALEKQESEVIKCYAPPPSSSGSDDGVGNAELTEQLNGDGDASGNSGPSSNSSRCGTAEAAGKTDDSSSDKDRNEEEKVALEEAAKALKASASFTHHHSHLFRNRKVPQQRAARPSRSSGSDGEQRKEVSQEGRMAFQALFSHQKLPQTFTTKVGGEVRKSLSEDNIMNIISSCEFSNRYSCDKSPNTTTSSLKISGFECMESESSPVKSKASDEDGGETGEEMSLATSKSSRRSGFVPYRRAAADVVVVTPTSCKAEENRLGATRPLIDDEVKA